MSFTPSPGDIIWLDFSPQSGHEQKGRRPALVISNDFFNLRTGLALVCPITSKKKTYPLHVELTNTTKITGYIMVEHIKSIDFSARNGQLIERAPQKILDEVLSRLHACF